MRFRLQISSDFLRGQVTDEFCAQFDNEQRSVPVLPFFSARGPIKNVRFTAKDRQKSGVAFRRKSRGGPKFRD